MSVFERCLICNKSFKNLKNHIMLKHGITWEDYIDEYLDSESDDESPELSNESPVVPKVSYIKPPVSRPYGLPQRPALAPKKQDFDVVMDRMLYRLEKMFMIKIMTDAVTGQQSIESVINKLKGTDGSNVQDIMKAIELGADLGAGQESEQPQQPQGDMVQNLIQAVASNPAIVDNFIKQFVK